jgi:phage head maturation protease
MSFGFRVLREEWDETEKTPKRTILEVALHEVSIVSEPAYDGATIALRSLEQARKERREHPAHRRIEARRAEMEQRIRRIR